jgi:isopentenyl phosphate kinase
MRASALSINPIVLKIGGSVITQKKKPLTAKPSNIQRLAEEISQAKVSPLIIIHGGGSFGHPLAKRHHIKEGWRSEKEQRMGLSETHQAMLTLNKLILDALIRNNIPAVSLSPISCTITKSGRIVTSINEPVKSLLEIGFVPVLYGDAVLDSDLGFTILSGDQLVATLALQLNAERIVMGIDVDGLFTADPKKKASAKLIKHITLDRLKEIENQIEEPDITDVTGGMRGKLSELREAIEKDIPVFVVNATEPKRVYKALKGDEVIGTYIEKDIRG